jgi:hypothetical protein
MPRPSGKLTRSELGELGYSPSSERYFAPTDPRADERGTISRRQAEQERYTAGGWSSRAQYERRYQGKIGRKLARFETEAIEQGKTRRAVEAPSSEFHRLFNAWRRTGFRESGTKNTPSARFLVYVGLRDPGAQYPVGSTPPRAG